MIKSKRVSDFYLFLKKTFFTKQEPDQIILISPNHFFPEMQRPVSICSTKSIKFKDTSIIAQARERERIICEQNVFYLQGEQWYTRDHGIGVHFPFIKKFFPKTKKIYILLMPSYRMYHARWLAQKIKKFQGSSLIIGSVDFSHYKSEQIAKKNDQISFSILSKRGSLNRLRTLDVDCPACLGVIDILAARENFKIKQRLRDSSSTILGKDMGIENTSRQFLWRE